MRLSCWARSAARDSAFLPNNPLFLKKSQEGATARRRIRSITDRYLIINDLIL
jgi:hypothetical protein